MSVSVRIPNLRCACGEGELVAVAPCHEPERAVALADEPTQAIALFAIGRGSPLRAWCAPCWRRQFGQVAEVAR